MKAYNSEDFLSKLNRIISYDKEEKINGIMDRLILMHLKNYI